MQDILDVLAEYRLCAHNNPVIMLNRQTGTLWVAAADQVYQDDAIMCLCSYLDPVDLLPDNEATTAAGMMHYKQRAINSYYNNQ